MLEVLEHLVHEVASERLVEVSMVERDHLVRKATRHKAVDGHTERLLAVEGPLGPGLSD